MPRARASWSGWDERSSPAMTDLLAAVIRIFAEEGFSVIAAHEVMREVLAPAGLLTQVGPDAQAMADIDRGVRVARLLGSVDVGQGFCPVCSMSRPPLTPPTAAAAASGSTRLRLCFRSCQ